MRNLKLLVVVAAAPLFAGCGLYKVCTAIGCGDPFSISLTPEGGQFAPGAYELETTLDEVSETCTFTVPECADPNDCAVTTDCDWGINARGAGYFSTSSPMSVAIVLKRDDTVLLDETVTPTYEESRPNGEDCTPVCTQAHLEYAVP